MNPRENREIPLTRNSASHALRCVNAIEDMEPNEDSWDDEVARLVQFSGMIEPDVLGYEND